MKKYIITLIIVIVTMYLLTTFSVGSFDLTILDTEYKILMSYLFICIYSLCCSIIYHKNILKKYETKN